MSNDSMPYRLPEAGSPMVDITFEGEVIHARATDTVAAAIVATGINTTRSTAVSDSPRGPFCMMGVCFDCLMEIDGVANKQGCMVRVAQGMTVRRMQGARHLVTDDNDSSTVDVATAAEDGMSDESDDSDDATEQDNESERV